MYEQNFSRLQILVRGPISTLVVNHHQPHDITWPLVGSVACVGNWNRLGGVPAAGNMGIDRGWRGGRPSGPSSQEVVTGWALLLISDQ
jgi:hypothetical protein